MLTPIPAPAFQFDKPHDDWSLNVSLFGTFEGVNAPSSRIEALLMAHVKRQHFAGAVNCYASRWFDYRRLPFGHSFMLFSREYLTAMQRGARDFINSRGPMRTKTGKVMTRAQVASHMKLYGATFTKQTEADIWERDTRYIVGLFKAMTVADMFGMPYDLFCSLAIRQAMEANWTRVPQPSNLYGEKLAAETINLWDAHTSQRLVAAKHPFYSIEHYVGHPAQDDYHAYLVKQIMRRVDDIAIPLSIVLFDKPQLPLALAEQTFDASVIRRAKSLAA